MKIETYSKSIESLFSIRSKSSIDYKPYYQRNYVWDYNKASYFIESILLGTEIPPLIFFHNNKNVEVIDGRQRFETILRFMENKFSLKSKGLSILKQLKNTSYEDLQKQEPSIIDMFLDAKLRIIEFRLVNEPPLDKFLEDRVKKEIFSRYNTGITPLKRAEIDNAIYDSDTLSESFKTHLREDKDAISLIGSTFFKATDSDAKIVSIETAMTFIRRNLALPMIPISYYMRGTGRTDLLAKMYEKFSDDCLGDEEQVVRTFFDKVRFLARVNRASIDRGLNVNRLALDCFLWALGICDLEEKKVVFNEILVEKISDHISNNFARFTEQDYNFEKEVRNRYASTGEFLMREFGISSGLYLAPNEDKRQEIKELRKPVNTTSKLSELESLRLNKPEPSRVCIDDIVRMMGRRKFLVRPSYQRKEVINPSKASSIIESILLGISLPAIFVFKRSNGINEVIDGQQRLLTLLGFIGSDYVDETDKRVYSKNHNFSLRKLRILKELESKSFSELDEAQRNKIMDFQLYLVEIDEVQNPEFNPIDLFIRLNDKPYPIRENSFEMWNSWVDVDTIQSIKRVREDLKDWFFLRQMNSANDRDRMENEELIASLLFLEYAKIIKDTRKTLDIYQKSERLNSRLGDKSYVSAFLLQVTENQGDAASLFVSALKNVNSFVRKLKMILLDSDKRKDELFGYLRDELDSVFLAGRSRRYIRRTTQDFYFIWRLLNNIQFEMVKFHRIEMKTELKNLFMYLRNIPIEEQINSKGLQKFNEMIERFELKYQVQERKVKLSEEERWSMLREQGSISPISGAPIFLGDEVEIDHEMPLAHGGADSIENLRAVHKEENRKKGAK